MEVDHRFFAALLAVWIGATAKISCLTPLSLVGLLSWLTIVSFWMKLSITAGGTRTTRLILYGTSIAFSYEIGKLLADTCSASYPPAQLPIITTLFPLLVIFWLIASEINRINWLRAFADLSLFKEGLNE
jgi:hypothetical protein